MAEQASWKDIFLVEAKKLHELSKQYYREEFFAKHEYVPVRLWASYPYKEFKDKDESMRSRTLLEVVDSGNRS